MAETIQIEITPTMAEMLAELEEEHGELVVRADLTEAVHQSIRQGYRQLTNNKGSRT